MTTLDWQKVGAVRIGIVARAEARDNTYTDTKIYTLPGGDNFTPTADARKYHRKKFIKTINIRNRVRS